MMRVGSAKDAGLHDPAGYGFERYSRECLVGNPADARLHQRLSALAESTHGMFELTLEQILAEEALRVPVLAKYVGSPSSAAPAPPHRETQ